MAAIFTHPHTVSRYRLVMSFMSAVCSVLWFMSNTGMWWVLGFIWAAAAVGHALLIVERRRS